MEKIKAIIKQCNGNPAEMADAIKELQFSVEELRQVAPEFDVESIQNHVLGNVSSYAASDLYTFIYQGLLTEQQLFRCAGKNISPEKRDEYSHLKSIGWDPKRKELIPEVEEPIDEKREEPTKTSDDTRGNEPQGDDTNPLAEEPLYSSPALDSEEELAWKNVDKNDPKALTLFLRDYPNGEHADEARPLLEYMPIHLPDLIEIVQNKNDVCGKMKDFFQYKWVTKDAFLGVFREDHNLMNSSLALELISQEVLTRDDFVRAGFDDEVISAIFGGLDCESYEGSFHATQLTREATEFYFWGISGSGKSCALGAIMSAANSGQVAKAMIVDEESDAASYLKYLRNVFREGELGRLPDGTPLGNFAAMGFTLVENSDPGNWLQRKIQGVSKAGREHPITCIDMAGAMLELLSQPVEELTEKQCEYIDNLQELLGNSPKGNHAQHFFLIEYKDDDLQIQFDQLNRAINHIKQLGLFKRKTDHIWIMVTKCDRFKAQSEEEMKYYVSEYLTSKCRPLYDKLSEICKEHGIDKGKPQVFPFWVGDVELQDFVRFDPQRANRMIEIMLETPFTSRQN